MLADSSAAANSTTSADSSSSSAAAATAAAPRPAPRGAARERARFAAHGALLRLVADLLAEGRGVAPEEVLRECAVGECPPRFGLPRAGSAAARLSPDLLAADEVIAEMRRDAPRLAFL